MNNEPVAWNEEEFNAIAYSYRSWLASDPKGVSERYEELVNYVQSIAHPVKELPTKEDEYWLMVEVLRAKVKEQQAEIAILRKASEK